ncbi:MAG: glycine--tRNA ligase subunit alpha, partial [Comamonadaceae bacterium]|nr:glycine--tRNA ligase subunit alpha [Comamonadaceae bacterium]
ARPRTLEGRHALSSPAAGRRRPLWREPQPPAALLSVPGHLKPSPSNFLALYLGSLGGARLRSDEERHPLCRGRLGKPHPGALGPGREVWFQRHGGHAVHLFPQVGGIDCQPATGEITLRPGAPWPCTCRAWTNVHNLRGWTDSRLLATSPCRTRRSSRPTTSSTRRRLSVHRVRRGTEKQAKYLMELQLALPATPAKVLKAAHSFNLLDARGAISVTERAAYIGRIRDLARTVAHS